MKLRFRKNSLRLRVNRREVEQLSTGQRLSEQVHFPNDTHLAYLLESVPSPSPQVEFQAGLIRVAVPRADLQIWAESDAIGMYFDLPANGTSLKVAVEKDLECVDGPEEERDADAYPRDNLRSCD